MDRISANPFCTCGEVDEIACINNWMQFSDLAEDYTRSADALVAAALDDSSLLDVHVQPVCFLYRHGIELLLKDLAWKSSYLATGTKRFAEKDWQELGRHRLRDIWEGAKADSETVLGTDFPLNPGRVDEVRSFLSQIEAHDQDSYSFRYPISKKKGRTHPHLTNVNLAALRAQVHSTFHQITAILDMIDCCLESDQ